MAARKLPFLVALALFVGAIAGSYRVQITRAQTQTITVYANNASGTDSGIYVQQNDSLQFSASGLWCLSGPVTNDRKYCNGPDGITQPRDSELPVALNGQKFGELLGRIGNWSFAIGSSNALQSLATGELYLLFNDRPCCYGDNSGYVTVSVSDFGSRSYSVL